MNLKLLNNIEQFFKVILFLNKRKCIYIYINSILICKAVFINSADRANYKLIS